MIVYLLKFIACSGLLILFYYAVLQNDRLFRFSRYFLLCIIALALIIPITVVRTKVIEIPEAPQQTTFVTAPNDLSLPNSTASLVYTETKAETRPLLSTKDLLRGIYGLVALLLLFRFTKNLISISRLKNKGTLVYEHGIRIVLSESITTSFSFLNHMYTNKTRYEQSNLPLEIITHEKYHIVQKHSYDIIFIELLQCLFWFNPFVYFIKKAIKLNHEFLADQHVLKDKTSAYEYQKILLGFTKKIGIQTPVFASNLNYGFTKKRINMMTKNTNKFKSMTKQVAAFGVIAFTFWMGGETRAIAREKEHIIDLNVTTDLEPLIVHYPERSVDLKVTVDQQDTTKKKVLKTPYHSINSLVRFKDKDGKLVEGKYQEFTKALKAQFLEAAATSGIEIFVNPPPKMEINQALLDEFKDSEKYGVWVDEKHISNDQLNDYSPSDFHHYNKSALLKTAKNYGEYTFHLTLTTNEYFESKPNLNGRWLPLKKTPLPEVPQQKNKDSKPQEYSYVRIPAPPFMLSQVRFTNKQGKMILKKYSDLSDDELARFQDKASNPGYFVPPPPPSYVDEEILKDFLNTEKYGIWLDGKKVDNSKVESLEPNDIYYFTKAKLGRNAKHYGEYSYQLTLVTREHFKKQPNSEGQWVDYPMPVIKEIPEQKTAKPKKKSKPQVKEIKVKEKNKNVKPKEKLKNRPSSKEKPSPQSLQKRPKIKAGQAQIELMSIPNDIDGATQNEISSNPFPTTVLHNNTLVRLSNANGETLETEYISLTKAMVEKFKSGNITFYNPPFDKEYLTKTELSEITSSQGLQIWIDSEKSNLEGLNQLELDLIHHTERIVSGSSSLINFVTDNGFIEQGGKNGRWIELPSSILDGLSQ